MSLRCGNKTVEAKNTFTLFNLKEQPYGKDFISHVSSPKAYEAGENGKSENGTICFDEQGSSRGGFDWIRRLSISNGGCPISTSPGNNGADTTGICSD